MMTFNTASHLLKALLLLSIVSYSSGQSSSSVAPPTTKDAFVSMETESPPSLITSHTSLPVTSSSSSALPSVSNISSVSTSTVSQTAMTSITPSQPAPFTTSVITMTQLTSDPMPTTLVPSFKPSSSQVETTPEIPSTLLVTSLITEDVTTTTTVPAEPETSPTSHTLPASNATTIQPGNSSEVTMEEILLATSLAQTLPTNLSMANGTTESATQGRSTTMRLIFSTEGEITDITNASVVTTEEPMFSSSAAPIQPTNQSLPNGTTEFPTQSNTTTAKTISTTVESITDTTLQPTNASMVTAKDPFLLTSVAPFLPTNHSTPDGTSESTPQGNSSTLKITSTTEGAVADITMPSTIGSGSIVTEEEFLSSTSVVPLQSTDHPTPYSTRESSTQGNISTVRVASATEGALIGTTTLSESNVSVVSTGEPILPTSVPSMQTTSHSMANDTRESSTQDYTNMMKSNSTTEDAGTQDMTTERIFVTKGSTPLLSPVSTTLDKSFSTMEYWVMMELSVSMKTDIRNTDFLNDLEINLAKSYQEARQRQKEKENEVKQLLRKLNPEDDIFLRKRRASTVDGNTAQIIDLSRNAEVQTTGELVYYINADGTNIPAMECATTYAELSVQELTLIMDVVVLSPVTAYNVIPTTPAPSRDTTFIILLSICIPFACLLCCMCSCCTYCVICGPKRARNERTMSPDTFKMLEFKQKFPYKPYTPNQTPRTVMGYPPSDDEEDFLSRSNKRVSIGGVWEESSSTARIIPDATSLSSSFRLPDKLPLSNRGLESSVRISEPPVVSYRDDSNQLQASPRNREENIENTRRLPAPPSSFLSDPNYVAAQMEISKILEPENVPAKHKPRKKRRKKPTSKAAIVEDGDKEKATGSWPQLPNDTQSEPLSEARQKVHALIEEAFSLVNFKGTSSTTVTKLPSKEDDKTPKEEDKESKPIVDRHVMDLLTGRKKEFGIQTMQPDQESKVVVVPVHHTPSLAETSSVLWNPYAARDELQKILPTREPASLPGDVNSSPPDVPATFRQNSPVSKETKRPHYPEGAENASFLFGDSSLDNFMKSREYESSNNMPLQNSFHSNEPPLTTESSHRNLRDNGYGRTFGNANYLAEFEKERKGRTSEYYDELDITSFMARRRPSRSLLDSIKSELMGTGRRIGDGKEVKEW